MAEATDDKAWTVYVSSGEREHRALDGSTVSAARRALKVSGCAVLRGLLADTGADPMRDEFLARYATLDARDMDLAAARPAPNLVLRVGPGRFEMNCVMAGAFARPDLIANPLLLAILEPLLGPEMQLSSCSVVASYPGAEAQHAHRDHDHLFPELDLGRLLPAYAISVAIPLVDVELEMGPTGVWPGSHTWPENRRPDPDTVVPVALRRGDSLLVDYRTLHMGLPNRSASVRPILYLVFARPWFFDEVNHRQRPPLLLPAASYEAFPPQAQRLLKRVRSRQIDPASLLR